MTVKTLKPPIAPYSCLSCGARAKERYARIHVDHDHGCSLWSWIRATYPRLARTIDRQRQRDLDEHARKTAA